MWSRIWHFFSRIFSWENSLFLHRSHTQPDLNCFPIWKQINGECIFVNFSTQFVWMLIFCSMLFVSVAFIISSRIYKKIYPGIKLNSNEVVLMPFRFVWPNPKSRFKVFIPIWLCKFTFYHNVLFIGHHVLLLLIVSQSSDWSSCPLIGHWWNFFSFFILSFLG